MMLSDRQQAPRHLHPSPTGGSVKALLLLLLLQCQQILLLLFRLWHRLAAASLRPALVSAVGLTMLAASGVQCHTVLKSRVLGGAGLVIAISEVQGQQLKLHSLLCLCG